MYRAMAIAGALFVATPVDAVELSYRWKAGTTYSFEAKSEDTITMAGMGVNSESKFVTRAKLALAIANVKQDGAAAGSLFIQGFEVTTVDGRKVAGIESIPKDALRTMVEIDRKGRFTFREVIYLLVDDDGQSLLVSASASAKGNAVSGTGRAGDQEVSVHAAFDPKTGKLSAGYSQETIREPKKKKVRVEQDATKVDVLPTQFLELFRLPDGDVSAGGSADLKVMQPGVDSSTKMTVEVKELTQARAQLRTIITSSTEADTTKRTAPSEGDLEVPGLGSMSVPGMEGGGSGSMGLEIEGEVMTDFSIAEGMLSSLEGTLTSDLEAMGMMRVTTRSKLALHRVK